MKIASRLKFRAKIVDCTDKNMIGIEVDVETVNPEQEWYKKGAIIKETYSEDAWIKYEIISKIVKEATKNK